MPKADCSLDEFVSSGIIPVEQKFEIFSKICSGVLFLHRKLIIHRDIKPENILLFSGTPKVADFGLCLIAGLARETQTNEAVGPRYYMAPELEDGQCLDVNYQADIYSLGKLFYYILSDGRIFSREKHRAYEWRLDIVLDDSRFNIFNSFFENSINTSVNRRYRNVEELLEALESAITEFENNPKTLLSARFTNLNESLLATPEVLSSLSTEEWLELLTTLHADNEIFNEGFLSVVCDSLDNKILDIVLKIVVSSDSYLDELFITEASKKILKFAAEVKFIFSFSKDSDLSRLVENVAKIVDSEIINNIVKLFRLQLSRNRLILQLVADNADLLGCEEKKDFLISTFNNDYVGKESLLVNMFEPDKMDLLSLEAVVAGLLRVGSDQSIQLVFDLANKVDNDDRRMGPVFRGVSLGLSDDNTENINSLNWTNETMKVLLDVHKRAELQSVSE